MLGEVVGSYEITEKLAEGGMGAVYRAKHKLLSRPAAVKVLLPELSNDREIVDRFFNEAKAATAIRHAGIVEIYDFGYMSNGAAYIAMELLDGESLSRRLAAVGRLDERHALVLLRGIASALAAAHAKGIIHRDLKPDNIFLVPDPDFPGGERPKLLDFGIAKVAEAQRGGSASKTRTGAVLGTPTYMSPEQCRGAGEIDHRSDLYALGCILYEMLTGRPPFQAEGIGELIGAHLFLEPDLPTTIVPELAIETQDLVLRLLQKDANDRLQSAQELAKLLGQGTVPPRATGQVTGTMGTMAQGSVHPTGTGGRVSRTPVPGSKTGSKTPAPVSKTPAGETAIGIGVGPGVRTPTPANRIAKHQTAVPTTLSGATGQQEVATQPAPVAFAEAPPAPAPAKKSKAPLFAGIGAVLVGGVVVAVLAGGGGGGAAKNNAAGPGPAPATGSETAQPALVVDAGVDAAQVAAPTLAPIDAGTAAETVIDAAPATEVAGTNSGSDRGGKHRDRTRTSTSKPGGKPDGTKSNGSGGASGGSAASGNFDRGD